MMLCPECGTENTDQAKFCINCHQHLLNKPPVDSDIHQRQNDERLIQSEPKTPQILKVSEKNSTHSSDTEKPVVSTGLNIGIIIGTIIFPVIGIAMGYTYFRKDHPDAKKAGKNWLIFGLIMILVYILLINLRK
jgi:hypothetical protein